MLVLKNRKIGRTLFPLLLFCLVTCPSGCAPHALRESPQVSLSGIQVREVGLLENAFLLQLRVTNPNDAAIEIQSMKCTLAINGRPFARGLSARAARVEAYSDTLVPVNVYSQTLEMASALARAVRSGAEGGEPFRYTLEGTALVKAGGFEVRKNFLSEGEWTLSDLPRGLRGR